jgi:hypothetical protein
MLTLLMVTDYVMRSVNTALGSAMGSGMFATCLIGGQIVRMGNGVRVSGTMVRG